MTDITDTSSTPVPVPISKLPLAMPALTDYLPVIVWHPDLLGPGVGGWVTSRTPVSSVGPPAPFGEAPQDGAIYGRQSGHWAIVPAGGIGTGNVLSSGSPVSGQLATWTGPFSITGVTISSLGLASLVSPGFLGNPQAPTPAIGDNDTSIATTAFVTTAVAAAVPAPPAAPVGSPIFTGIPKAPTPLPTDSSTQLATTAFVKGAIAAIPPLTVNIRTFTSNASYIPTPGTSYVIVECVGAGAGGGGVIGSGSFIFVGGGGGSGSYSRKFLSAATIGASQSIAVGTGGAGGPAGGATPGGDGGDTSFGTFCIAHGGKGGAGYNGSGAGQLTGFGGAAGTGDVTTTGAAGDKSNWSSSDPVGTAFGGNSVLGGGGGQVLPILSGTSPGLAGGTYGAGGGGGIQFDSSVGGSAGGHGSDGVVIVTEYGGSVGTGGGGIPEAPIDGQIYGRNNATWTPIIQGGQSGTVINGVAGQLAIYPATGTTVGPATAAQATAVLNVFTPTLAGLVPFSGGGPLNFLRADGIWTIPPGGSGSGTVSTGTLNQIAYYNTAGTTVQGETLLQALNMPAFTGDVTSPGGSLVNTIATGVVSNAKLATMPAISFKANSVGVAGPPQDISASVATGMLSLFTSGAQGVVPLSGGGTLNFLRADGLWAPPPGGGGAGQNPGGASNSVQYNNSGVFGGYTNSQLTSLVQTFTPTLSGAVPLSGGGTVNFLRADGAWAAAGMFIASFLNSPLTTFNVYVATTGNDANPGTAALPFRTIQKGVNALLHAVCPQSEYGAVQLNVADGSYNEQVFCGPTFGTFIIQGNTNNPQNVVVTSSGPVFIFAGPASWILSGFELHGTNSFGKFGLVDNVGNMCSLLVGSCNFGNNAGAPHVTSTYNGDGNCGVTTIESVKIVGSATALFGSASGGYCELSHGTVDCNGLNPWTTAVITCGQNGRALIRAVPDFSWANAGAVTAPKVNCSDGGRVIFDNMVEVPGTAPVIETGGWVYDNNNNTNAQIIGPSFTGDTGSGGKIGYVPAPAAGDNAAGKFLRANGTWAVPAGGGSSGITIGTTPITGGTTTRVLYDLSGSIQESTNLTIISNNPNIVSGGQLLYNGTQMLQAQTTLGNTYFGGSGNLTGTGTNNYANGAGALVAVTTGANNVAFGALALHALTTGVQNVAIGGGNVLALEQTHGHNVAIGFGALALQTGADFNTCVGIDTGSAITTGDGNTFIGNAAGYAVTTGRANVIIGGYGGDSGTMSNNIILSDGDTTVQLQYNNGWIMGPATGGGQGVGTLNVSGNVFKNGVAIGTGGGGSGTVGSGTVNQIAFYNVTGTAVVGETLIQAANMPALTGDVISSAGSVATTIASGAVSNAKLATMAATTIKGNATAGVAAPTDMSAATTWGILGVEPAANSPALTGDITKPAGSLAVTLTNAAVSNAKLTSMATTTIKGNSTGSTAAPQDLTATQVTAMLNAVTSSLKGLAPASGGGTVNFLRADGSWSPAGAGTPGGYFQLEAGSSPIKVSAFSAAATPVGTEQVPGVQGGSNVAFTVNQLVTRANAAGGSGAVGTSLLMSAGAGDGGANGGDFHARAGASTGGYGGNIFFAGGNTASGTYGGTVGIYGGICYSAGGTGGVLRMAAGEGTHNGGFAYFGGGKGVGGNGGGLILYGGTGSTKGGDINFNPGTGTVKGKFIFQNAVSTPGTFNGTLTNAPAAGNPQFWFTITINGVVYMIPAWHV